jgi:Tol biopolymer transport system component
MPISVGTRFGAYEVTSPLGSGGMGEVYRARDTNLKRDVALKALPSALANDADRLARFQREAEVLASLNHPNIAQIYGLERSEGTTALAMELIDGPTLEDRISQGRIPVEEALRVASQMADALEAAHERGIVHRDLKPANIKVRPDGTVKVLDFGIAKALDSRATTGPGPAALTTPAMTEAGFVLGTAAYMSPEQARGRPVDRRTDIWAFGCVLYEMLTGQPAFLGEDVTSTLARVLQAGADLSALPSDASASVRRTLELCFEKDVRKRIADMHDVRLALAGAFALGSPAAPLWRRALPSAATLLGGLLLASVYFLSSRPPAGPANVAAPAPVSRFVITPPATAPLANQGGLDLTISPDGKRIAYLAVKPESGKVEIYVRELDALEARPIAGTEVADAGPFNPFFSPDGKSIGYSSPDRGLVSVAIDGRPPIKLADRPTPGFTGGWWAGDNTVIFSSGRRLQHVSAAGGGTPTPLVPERQTSVAAPVLLPGGRAMLFHAYGDSAGDRVDALDLDTGEEKTVVEGGSNPSYVDTGHLVFVRGDTLMAVPFKASELAVTGEPVALVQGIRRSSGGAADYALSANGTLAYVPGNADATSSSAVVWVDRTGKVTGRAVPDLIANPRDPRLSPDGKRLLLVTGQENDGDLWSYDLSGRPPIPLALPNDNRAPVWSPDGRQVAFFSPQIGGVMTLPADGSERTTRPLRAQLLAPHVWSAAGELILVAPGSGDIVATPAMPTGEVRNVVASESFEFDPALSPNGRWLAYISNRTGQAEIWVQGHPEGAPPVRVSSSTGYEPLWSADGRELFYRQGAAMMAVAVETGNEFSFAPPRPLFSGPYVQRPNPGSRSYDVARDGRFLMILRGDENRPTASASIVVVQNFGEELKQRVRPSGK